MNTINAIQKLNKIFKSNKWMEKDIDDFVFDNFCYLLNNLNEEQRVLIIELIERYKWISLTDYPAKILSTMDKVEDEKLKNIKTIYFFPIIKPEDEGKFKSGQFLLYQIKCFKQNLNKYKSIRFELISKYETFKNDSFRLKSNEAIFLIDDYIGSGETLFACLEEIQKNVNISEDKLNIITIASQFEVATTIKSKGISYYADFISKKGISDYEDSENGQAKIEIMLQIEELIPGGHFFSLGYNKSEALITMARTPDNTFPIFWKAYKKGGTKFEAPFSRGEFLNNE